MAFIQHRTKPCSAVPPKFPLVLGGALPDNGGNPFLPTPERFSKTALRGRSFTTVPKACTGRLLSALFRGTTRLVSAFVGRILCCSGGFVNGISRISMKFCPSNKQEGDFRNFFGDYKGSAGKESLPGAEVVRPVGVRSIG